MRDRYWVRIGRIDRALRTIMVECFREWNVKDRPPPYTEFKNRWLLENYNIIINKQINGVEKVGFKSKGDMILFVLKHS